MSAFFPRSRSSLSATISLACKTRTSGLRVFFLPRFRFHTPTETSSAPFLSTSRSSCTARYFPPVTWTCIRTFVRVHYKRVHRRGASRRNIDVPLKLNRIDDENDDVPRPAPPFLPSLALFVAVAIPMPPRCTIPMCTEMRVRASLSSLLPRFPS